MADLTASFVGIRSPNPFWLASAPPTDKAYNVIRAFQAGKSKLARGNDSDSLYKAAYDYINTHGKDLHGQPLGKYFIHGLGHHVGLARGGALVVGAVERHGRAAEDHARVERQVRLPREPRAAPGQRARSSRHAARTWGSRASIGPSLSITMSARASRCSRPA